MAVAFPALTMRLRSRTVALVALTVITPSTAAAEPAQSMVIDCEMVRPPKAPESTQLISPLGSVASCAAWKVAHGAARVQAAPPPLPDTQVRGMASAGVAASSGTAQADSRT